MPRKRALQAVPAVEATRPAPLVYPTPGRSVRRLRTRLQQRRPRAIRRHAVRWLLRTASIFAVDIAAVLTVRSLILGADGIPTLAPAIAAAFGMLAQVYQIEAHVAAALVVSLIATGNYSRRGGAHSSVSLLRGCVLAGTLMLWRTLLDLGPLATAVSFVAAVALTWGVVRAGRAIGSWFVTEVWPGSRSAAPAVFVGSSSDYTVAVQGPMGRSAGDYRLVGYVSPISESDSAALGQVADLPELIDVHAVETIIVGGTISDAELAMVLDTSITAGCELLCSARSIQIAGSRPRIVWREEQPYFELKAPVLEAHALLVKRTVDVLGAAVALLLLAPVLVAIAASIKLHSPGPVLFTQHRAGLGGRRFRMLKFRTMRPGADAEKERLAALNLTGDRRLFKIPSDPRVTPLGAWLRRWSLDELPQLWNVLRGDMSLVGPRPFFESDLDDYEDHHFRRLGAKPGITGLWQVSGRSSVVDFEEVVRLDREYIEEWSLLLDLRIMVRTVPAVLGRRGAY